MITERLSREKAKYADYDTLKEKADKFDQAEEASKTELQKANDKAAKLQKELEELKSADKVREIREKVAKEKQIPASLLTGSTEEECTAQADAILSFAKPDDYPSVKDGGETNVSSGKKTTREQFENWVEQMTKGGN
jgi:uncharacterized protein YhaN